MSANLRPINLEQCSLYTLEEFIEHVKNGVFVDTDGHGYYANSKFFSTEYAWPSELLKGNVLEGWTHVAWFNK